MEAPTLVIHGDADAIVPIEASAKRTASVIDGAQLVVTKGEALERDDVAYLHMGSARNNCYQVRIERA